MEQKGSLPINGQITFDFSEEALMLVAKGLSKRITVSSIISFPDQPSITKKRINVVVTRVHPAESFGINAKTFFLEQPSEDLIKKNETKAFGRVRDYLNNQILARITWLIIGHIEDGSKKIPIMIFYVPSLNTGSYSFKKDSETEAEFVPQLN